MTIEEDEDGVTEVDEGLTAGAELLDTDVGTTTTDEETALVTKVKLSVLEKMIVPELAVWDVEAAADDGDVCAGETRVLVQAVDVGCNAEVVAKTDET